ncbi:MAG: calcium-binding protein, partial [Caldilineaceae bacterium]
EAGDRGVVVNLSNEPVQANIGYGIATAAALMALDTFGDEQALADDVQEVVGTNNEDALFAGTTSVTFDALDGDDSLRGSSVDDTLIGGAGDDYLAGAGGADRIEGGSGADTVDYSDSTAGVSINLDDAGTASTAATNFAAPEEGHIGGGYAEGNSLTGIENIVGSSQDDVLIGNAAANRLEGGAGDDVLRGEAGNDMLLGDEGNDTLVGGAGNDTLDGGDGTDTVDYGQEGGPHGVIVNLSDAPVTADIGDGEVTVSANSAIDTFGDIDLLSGIDSIIGTEHRDVLVGAGDGVKLTGGGGADSFVLTGTDIADLIVDYNQAEGDVVDLTALYHQFTEPGSGNEGVTADQFISEQVQYDQNTGALSVDMDGDSTNGYETQVATVNSSVDSDISNTAAAYVPDSVTIVVEDQSASTPIV